MDDFTPYFICLSLCLCCRFHDMTTFSRADIFTFLQQGGMHNGYSMRFGFHPSSFIFLVITQIGDFCLLGDYLTACTRSPFFSLKVLGILLQSTYQRCAFIFTCMIIEQCLSFLLDSLHHVRKNHDCLPF